MYKKILALLVVGTMMGTLHAQDKQLVILHTNDTHSCIMPLNPNLADTTKADRGGFLRRVVMVKEERTKNPELLLIDSGDFSQGSPYYTLFKGDVEIGLMNEMKYDASTIGNHEFDFGIENMARLFKKANFPILCSNYDFTGTPLEGIVKPYTIVKRNGLTIGLFAVDPKMEGLVIAKNCQGIKYLDPIICAQQMVQTLKRLGCDAIVCISHLGWNIGGDDDNKLVANTRGIDLVLGGHSHSLLKELVYVKNLDGKDIPIDQNGKNAIYVAKLTLDFNKKSSEETLRYSK